MNALESPLEALAINYLSYSFLTAVNSVWTWVAVITAAVSFWKIGATSSSPISRLIKPRIRSHQDGASTSSTPLAVHGDDDAIIPAATSDTLHLSTKPTPSSRVLEREGGSAGVKFTVYYTEDVDYCDDGVENDDNDGEAAASDEKLGRRCDYDWERMMMVRMGDLGWYRCQDLTVLDGSVVRLWDSRGIATAI